MTRTGPRFVDGIMVFGEPDEKTMQQARTIANTGNVAGMVMCGDSHLGYSMPIGGVVAYRDQISPSGVGYDIACGIMAVRTDALAADVRPNIGSILDDIARNVSFGLGRSNPTSVDHELFDSTTWVDNKAIGSLKDKARAQLGTVGSGNHFVDLLEGEDGVLWIAAHFGSRGLGHATATGFLNLAAGRGFFDRPPAEDMMAAPTLIDANSHLGDDYIDAMELAGRYAYAGREYVMEQVLEILGATERDRVHNHHNFGFYEEHNGEKVWVVRKGATPAFPGQRGFVGGSMGDWAAIVEGIDTEEARQAFRSTMHGAGRIMSRSQARGKRGRQGQEKRAGLVTRQMMSAATKDFGVVVRGGDVDESPHVYRPLRDVVAAHAGSVVVREWLRPIGVVMAGADVVDPFKD